MSACNDVMDNLKSKASRHGAPGHGPLELVIHERKRPGPTVYYLLGGNREREWPRGVLLTFMVWGCCTVSCKE